MMRTFEFGVEDTLYDHEVDSKIVINDEEYGLIWEFVGGNTYRLSSQNIRDLREILAQVEDDPSN